MTPNYFYASDYQFKNRKKTYLEISSGLSDVFGNLSGSHNFITGPTKFPKKCIARENSIIEPIFVLKSWIFIILQDVGVILFRENCRIFQKVVWKV